ncbi:hypothetical protein QQF64_036442 [Cirrhinus molitorella]|uniref:Uncharacterized protein n=1 Tax=Cirrhinus molitorella TaxID=172907 RepID=A0ABR3NIT5_9TELE
MTSSIRDTFPARQTHPSPAHASIMKEAPRLTLSPTSVASWLEDPSSLPPASESRTPPRPFDLSAPSSLLFTVAHQSTSSAGLPAPSGSTLVCRRPSAASGFHSSSYGLSFHPSSSVRLLLPSGSSSVLGRSGSTAAFWIPVSASVAGAICSALALRILPIALAHRLSVSASGSSSTCSAAVDT